MESPGPNDVALKIEASCDECDHICQTTGRPREPRPHPHVLMEMEPGNDGKPWFLCIQHWFDGLHPNDPARIGSGKVLEIEPKTIAIAPPKQEPQTKRSHADKDQGKDREAARKVRGHGARTRTSAPG